MFVSPKMSDLTILTCICAKFVIREMTHFSAEGGDVCAFPQNLKFKHNPAQARFGTAQIHKPIASKEIGNLQCRADFSVQTTNHGDWPLTLCQLAALTILIHLLVTDFGAQQTSYLLIWVRVLSEAQTCMLNLFSVSSTLDAHCSFTGQTRTNSDGKPEACVSYMQDFSMSKKE